MKKGKIVREFSSVEMQKLPAEELMSMGLRNLSYDNLEIQNYNEAKTFMRIHDFIFRYKGSKKLSLFIGKGFHFGLDHIGQKGFYLVFAFFMDEVAGSDDGNQTIPAFLTGTAGTVQFA